MVRQIIEHPAAARLREQVSSFPMGGASVPPDLPLRAREVLGERLGMSREELEAWRSLPFDEEQYRKGEVGSKELVGEAGYSVLERTGAQDISSSGESSADYEVNSVSRT